MNLAMFSKLLAPLSVAEAGRTIKELGFAGVDLTVREGGHVKPEEAAAGLPAAVKTLADLGLTVPLITTSLTSAASPHAAAVVEAAAKAGIPDLKLGYWPYRGAGTLAADLAAVHRDLDGLERLAAGAGLRVNLHTHSGDYLTASAHTVWELIKDRHPRAVGAYPDPGHLTIEGGLAGWKIGLDRLAGRIGVVAIKDFEWTRVKEGKGGWAPRLVPLERGMVPWPNVFAALRTGGFDGWCSVHSEYQGSWSWRDLSLPELIEQTRRDVAYLGSVLPVS